MSDITGGEEPNPYFDGLGSIPKIAAFLYKQHGADVARQFLEPSKLTTRESLEDVVAEPKASGLGKVAAIAAEIAANTPDSNH